MRIVRALGWLIAAIGIALVSAAALGIGDFTPRLLFGFALVVVGATLAGVARALAASPQ